METYGKNLLINDPFVLNEKVDHQWTYSKDRIQLLRELAKKDEEYQQNKGKYDPYDSNQIQSSSQTPDQSTGNQKSKKHGFLSLRRIFGIKNSQSSSNQKNMSTNNNSYNSGITVGNEQLRGSTAALRASRVPGHEND